MAIFRGYVKLPGSKKRYEAFTAWFSCSVSSGVIFNTHLGGIKKCKCMVLFLRDFPYNSALFGLVLLWPTVGKHNKCMVIFRDFERLIFLTRWFFSRRHVNAPKIIQKTNVNAELPGIQVETLFGKIEKQSQPKSWWSVFFPPACLAITFFFPRKNNTAFGKYEIVGERFLPSPPKKAWNGKSSSAPPRVLLD